MLVTHLVLAIPSAPSARPPAEYDTCKRPAVAGRWRINSSIPDPFGSDESLVEAVCCDQRNRQYAEPQGLFADVDLFAHLDPSGVTTFYDSASGLPLFRAPVNRTLDDFHAETEEHGWPSFRAAEVIMHNVQTDHINGLVSSVSGTHLGSYLPDASGPRWCIDLSCISGKPHSQLQTADRSAAEVPLVRFSSSAPKALQHTWQALNDPVMGGQSSSRVAVENGVLNFTGVCAIVPSLKAPGFVTAVTGQSWLHRERFVDVSKCAGLKITARDYSGGYQGYRVSFGTAKPPGGKYFAQGYKANLFPKVGSFDAVYIPFTNFTDFWDDATGDPIHTCAEKKEYCPDEKTLRDMRTMSIWAEGVEGKIHLEINAIDGYGCVMD